MVRYYSSDSSDNKTIIYIGVGVGVLLLVIFICACCACLGDSAEAAPSVDVNVQDGGDAGRSTAAATAPADSTVTVHYVLHVDPPQASNNSSNHAIRYDPNFGYYVLGTSNGQPVVIPVNIPAGLPGVSGAPDATVDGVVNRSAV